jgi:hypothetical protein
MTPYLVIMEACVGAQYLGRRVEPIGHEVQLRPTHRSIGAVARLNSRQQACLVPVRRADA